MKFWTGRIACEPGPVEIEHNADKSMTYVLEPGTGRMIYPFTDSEWTNSGSTSVSTMLSAVKHEIPTARRRRSRCVRVREAREAPREFAEAICYSKHGVENPDRAPHLHGHTPRSSAIMHFISDGYWLFQRLDTGFIYALNGEDSRRSIVRL